MPRVGIELLYEAFEIRAFRPMWALDRVKIIAEVESALDKMLVRRVDQLANDCI
jgi:hypothetical protein